MDAVKQFKDADFKVFRPVDMKEEDVLCGDLQVVVQRVLDEKYYSRVHLMTQTQNTEIIIGKGIEDICLLPFLLIIN
jgi:hypothetical protein